MINTTRPIGETQVATRKPIDRGLQNNLKENKFTEDSFERDNQHKIKKDLGKEELEDAIKKANQMIFKDDNRFEFKVHGRTGRIMVKLINNETNEVVKEIPPEKILDLVASIWDLVGILVDERG